ncbi:YbdD/YjiX family protein [Pseudochrobactrum kiredjianiae]|uniref:YbdD/YjiX family protein n=1 Tax=Pseudochrobactrum kiredjianiae TaxID=386305 RepID=A0ABW3V5Y0_9HYPH|nr:YbdD/YjiX family protein [Pseudochrobactrum kiredjianiae]MDM7852316.1 YbdD/YjiX family protein [Pseudochrobactrum kiredjianiae]
MFDKMIRVGKCACQTAMLMIGVPDYDNYVRHLKQNHPDQLPMTYAAFFRERQDVRYGGKGSFKCC